MIISQAYQLQAQKSSQLPHIFIILKNLIISMKNTTLSIQNKWSLQKVWKHQHRETFFGIGAIWLPLFRRNGHMNAPSLLLPLHKKACMNKKLNKRELRLRGFQLEPWHYLNWICQCIIIMKIQHVHQFVIPTVEHSFSFFKDSIMPK